MLRHARRSPIRYIHREAWQQSWAEKGHAMEEARARLARGMAAPPPPLIFREKEVLPSQRPGSRWDALASGGRSAMALTFWFWPS